MKTLVEIKSLAFSFQIASSRSIPSEISMYHKRWNGKRKPFSVLIKIFRKRLYNQRHNFMNLLLSLQPQKFPSSENNWKTFIFPREIKSKGWGKGKLFAVLEAANMAQVLIETLLYFWGSPQFIDPREASIIFPLISLKQGEKSFSMNSRERKCSNRKTDNVAGKWEKLEHSK